jgi:hypothetical protein
MMCSYATRATKGPGKFADRARTFYFTSESAELQEWRRQIQANIDILALKSHPVLQFQRLVAAVGGHVSEGDVIEELLDTLYCYSSAASASVSASEDAR